jgi:cytochrome c
MVRRAEAEWDIMRATRILGVIATLLLALPAAAQMRGHGGPVRALAITGDGRLAVSGGFDQAASGRSIPGRR